MHGGGCDGHGCGCATLSERQADITHALVARAGDAWRASQAGCGHTGVAGALFRARVPRGRWRARQELPRVLCDGVSARSHAAHTASAPCRNKTHPLNQPTTRHKKPPLVVFALAVLNRFSARFFLFLVRGNSTSHFHFRLPCRVERGRHSHTSKFHVKFPGCQAAAGCCLLLVAPCFLLSCVATASFFSPLSSFTTIGFQ